MAVGQRRTSKTRKRLRRTHFKLNVPGLVKCSHCGEAIKPHQVCPHCGYYNGKLVVKTKAVKKAEKAEAAAKAKDKKEKSKK